MKERVTLTIDNSILRQVDGTIDGTRVRNRSHAVELLLREALKGDLPETAVILGGGTDEDVNKCTRIVNGAPVIQHNVNQVIRAGIPRIIVVSKDPEKMEEAVGQTKEGINIQYISEPQALGSAGILHLARPYINGTFILTNGDTLAELHIKQMFDFHKQSAGKCTIALTTTPDPSKFGVALLNGNRIVTFVEKPDQKNAPSNLISAGFYMMEREVIDHVPDGYARLEVDIFPKLVKDDSLYGFPYSGGHLRPE